MVRKPRKKIIIFTDLDGTLLDMDTYSFDEAKNALRIIELVKTPLILCSSKTRKEIEVYRERLKNFHPFISENGGAVFIPPNYFKRKYFFDRNEKDYKIIEIGVEYSRLIPIFSELKKNTGLKLRGFSEMKVEEIIKLTGLPEEEAKLAKEREYSESFLLVNKTEETVKILYDTAKRMGLTLTEGGRFFNLSIGNDKGKAIKKLMNIFRREIGKDTLTLGLGDSMNDLPLLKAVDFPVLIRRKDRSVEWGIKLKLENVKISRVPGPAGWDEEVEEFLFKYY